MREMLKRALGDLLGRPIPAVASAEAAGEKPFDAGECAFVAVAHLTEVLRTEGNLPVETQHAIAAIQDRLLKGEV